MISFEKLFELASDILDISLQDISVFLFEDGTLYLEMYVVVSRKYLEEYFNSSFMQFENCCGVCWCCLRKKQILDEIGKKRFNSFN